MKLDVLQIFEETKMEGAKIRGATRKISYKIHTYLYQKNVILNI